MAIRWQLAVVLLAALAVRLLAGSAWHARAAGPFVFPDSESYWSLAGQLARGEVFQFGGPEGLVFRTPGYPWLLSLVRRWAEDESALVWARALSAVLGTLSVGGVYWLGREYQNHTTGIVAATMVAVLPEAVGLGVYVLSEAAFAPLMPLQLGLMIRAWRTESVRTALGLSLLAGVAAGLATLVRPSWLLFSPLALAFGFLFPNRQRHLMLAAALLGGLLLSMAPWWYRNAQVTGHFVPTTLEVGASLYDGLNPQADGSSDMRHGDLLATEFRDRWIADHPGQIPGGAYAYERDRYLRQRALSWAFENPLRVVELAGIKLLRMWNLWPNEPALRSWAIRLAVVLSYGPLMALCLWGAWKLRNQGWQTALLWLPAAYFTLLHVVFVSSIRYRQPALLPLAVLAAAAVSQIQARRHASVRIVV